MKEEGAIRALNYKKEPFRFRSVRICYRCVALPIVPPLPPSHLSNYPHIYSMFTMEQMDGTISSGRRLLSPPPSFFLILRAWWPTQTLTSGHQTGKTGLCPLAAALTLHPRYPSGKSVQ